MARQSMKFRRGRTKWWCENHLNHFFRSQELVCSIDSASARHTKKSHKSRSMFINSASRAFESMFAYWFRHKSKLSSNKFALRMGIKELFSHRQMSTENLSKSQPIWIINWEIPFQPLTEFFTWLAFQRRVRQRKQASWKFQ